MSLSDCQWIHAAHRPRRSEWVANQLANRILLPTRWLGSAGTACGWDLFSLKRRFASASHELIVRRMPRVRTADRGQHLRPRRNFVPSGQPERPSRADSLGTRLLAHRSRKWRGSPALGRRLYGVRGWPVHEEGWKRELLRLDLLEEPEMWCPDEVAICDD